MYPSSRKSHPEETDHRTGNKWTDKWGTVYGIKAVMRRRFILMPIIFVTRGQPQYGFKSSLTPLINDYARKTSLLKENEGNLTGEDIREGLTAVISVKLLGTVEGRQKQNWVTVKSVALWILFVMKASALSGGKPAGCGKYWKSNSRPE